MEFKLSSEVIDQVIFAMENQEEEFFFDTSSCSVVEQDRVDPIAEELRYEPLPPWSSLDGFKLMERFVSTLRNPIYREKLKAVLSSGKGVFRSFKDVLKDRPDIERLWYGFKEKELQKTVVEWYEGICDARGYQKMLPEKEDTGDLVLSDFVITEGTDRYLDLMESLDRKAYGDNLEGLPPGMPGVLQNERERALAAAEGSPFALYAETPGGEFAGFILARERASEARDPFGIRIIIARIVQLYVAEEYRGLGIADVLLSRYLASAAARGIDSLIIDIAGQALSCAEALSSRGFLPLAQTFYLKLQAPETEG